MRPGPPGKKVPLAGNFFQQELAVVTGAVEAMIVDVQCIMPVLPDIAKKYHTKIISTNPKAEIAGDMGDGPFDGPVCRGVRNRDDI